MLYTPELLKLWPQESFWNLGVSGLSSRSQTGAVRNVPQPSPSVDPRDSVCLIQTPTQFLFGKRGVVACREDL